MKSHRGLSAVVGTVFLVAVVIGALSYISYSLDVMGNFSESLIAEESRQKDKQSEAFQIESIDVTDANKLDGVIKNTGQIPIQITTLYIDEQGVNDVVNKNNINEIIAPGNTVHIRDLVDVDMDPTKGYNMKLVTSRGGVQEFYVNSLANERLYMSLIATPTIIPSTFSTNVVLTVVNNMSNGNHLYNLTPIMDTTVQQLSETSDGLTTNKINGPIPSSYESLGPGETAIFSWEYEMTSETDLDTQIFNVTLANANAANYAETFAKIKAVPLASEAGTSLTSLGITDSTGTKPDVLFFHLDNGLTPNDEFPMDPSSPSSAGVTVRPNTQTLEFISSTMVDNTLLPNGTFSLAMNYFSNPVPLGFPEPSFAFFMDSKDCGQSERICDFINLMDNDDGFQEQGGKPKFSKDGAPNTPAGGPDNDEYFHLSDGEYFRDDWNVDGDSEDNYGEPEDEPDTTAIWIRMEPTTKNQTPIVVWGDGTPASAWDVHEDTYGFWMINSGYIRYGWTTEHNHSAISSVYCDSSVANPNKYYDDNQWHHVVGVRDSSGPHSCSLYIDGQLITTKSETRAGDDLVEVDTISIGNDRYESEFGGDIASLIHWNDDELNAAQVEDLYYTNYGVNATRLSMKIDITEEDGTFKSNVVPLTEMRLPFHDPTLRQDAADPNPWLGFHIANTTDLKYSQHIATYTTSVNNTLLANERLKLTLDWQGKNEQNLPINIMFDDSVGWTYPDGPSYLETPTPIPRWPSFLSFDSLQKIVYTAFNEGPEGVWFVYSGTRIVLTSNDGLTSWSAVPEYVNKTQAPAGCNNSCKIDAFQDSIYIPNQYYAAIEFYPIQSPPTNDATPCGACEVESGQYDAALYLQGYTESGETFKKTVDLGLIQITGNP